MFNLITAHTPIGTQSSNFAIFRLQPVYFYLLLNKSMCCGNSYELPQQVKAIQMSANNKCFFFNGNLKKNITQASLNIPLVKSSADLSLKCAFITWIFYYKFFPVILKNLSA